MEAKAQKITCIIHNVALGGDHLVTRADSDEVILADELFKGDSAEVDADLAELLIKAKQVKRG